MMWPGLVQFAEEDTLAYGSHPFKQHGLTNGVDAFTPLLGQMTVEISARLAKASRAFGTLRSSVFSNRDLAIKTKLHVYSAVVLSTLLYGCETWEIKAVAVCRLAAFHHRCVRFLLDIPRETQWQEHISNTTLLERAKMQPIEEALKTRRHPPPPPTHTHLAWCTAAKCLATPPPRQGRVEERVRENTHTHNIYTHMMFNK